MSEESHDSERLPLSRRAFLARSTAAVTAGAAGLGLKMDGPVKHPAGKRAVTPYDVITVEGHRDIYEFNDRFGDGEDSPLRDSMIQRYMDGGMNVIIMPVSGTAPRHRHGNNKMLEGSLQTLDMILTEIEKTNGKAGVILNRDDIPDEPTRDKVWFFLDMEGAEPIQINPESDIRRDLRMSLVRSFYRMGVRGIQITHNERNYLADGIQLEGTSAGGITPFGRDVIREMNRLGMMVGVSHLADRSLYEAAEITTAPLVSSHTNVNMSGDARIDEPRQHHDEEIRTIAETGGLVAIRYIIDGNGHTPYSLLADEIDHIADLVGVEHTGVGWLGHDVGDPRGGAHEGHTDVELQTFYEHWDNFMQILSQRGYSDDDIALVAGGNFLNIWREILK